MAIPLIPSIWSALTWVGVRLATVFSFVVAHTWARNMLGIVALVGMSVTAINFGLDWAIEQLTNIEAGLSGAVSPDSQFMTAALAFRGKLQSLPVGIYACKCFAFDSLALAVSVSIPVLLACVLIRVWRVVIGIIRG